MNFEFATAGKIRFGEGVASGVGDAAARLASRVLVVYGKSSGRVEWLHEQLEHQGLAHIQFSVNREPDIDLVRQGLKHAGSYECDGVISCGGGSVIDAAKAIGILFTNGGDPMDYLEVVGRGLPLTKPSLPHIALPTTAGTGAEVTKNAVLYVSEARVKVSLRSEHMLPNLAVIDPLLTYSMPKSVTASSGLDALTQCIEPYVSAQANAITDLFALEGVRRAATALPAVYENGDASVARADMAFASLLGGLALANAKLGAVHGFAGVIGGMYSAPHGAVCARLLPYVWEQNVLALTTREPASPLLRRFKKIAAILTGNPAATAGDGSAWLRKICAKLGVPTLRAYGVSMGDAQKIVSKAAVSSSMQGNPIALEQAELQGILEQAIG